MIRLRRLRSYGSVLTALWLLTFVFADGAQASSDPVPDEVRVRISTLKEACAAWAPEALSATATPKPRTPDGEPVPPERRTCNLVANPESEAAATMVFGAAAMFGGLSLGAVLLGCLLALFRFGEHQVGAMLGRRRSLGRAETGDVA